MNLIVKYKIQLNLKRMTFDELSWIKKFVDDEMKKRKKNLIEHK